LESGEREAMTARDLTLLLAVPLNYVGLWTVPLAKLAPDLKSPVHGRDSYDPKDVDYALSFRPEPGLLKSLPNLKAVFSLGAGVDGFLTDPTYPKNVPLVRFVDHGLSREMAQYVLLHTLMFHRQQRFFDHAQAERKWRQNFPPRSTEDTRVGILGLGEIGTLAATHLRDLDFQVAGWSRTRKNVAGIKSFAGADELNAFLARTDILVCVLPLTPDTRNILNRDTFAQLPAGAFVINVARGGHLVEDDVIAAIDSGHLAGAALDVFQTEPLPESSPLWAHAKIKVTPHVAGMSDPWAATRWVLDGMARHARGEKLANVVDMSLGY
jgi:glyoxylate/hydroxypyruvate reductase A